MRLLDRYLLRELLAPLGYCLAGFLILWDAFDLANELHGMQERGLGFGDVASYYFFKTPEFFINVLPMTLLLALLYTLTNHARHNEFTAIRTAGVSLWRLSLPYFFIGSIGTLALFALNEFCAPPAAEIAEQIRKPSDQKRSKPTARPQQVTQLDLENAREHRTWHIASYNRLTGEMTGPVVKWDRPDGSSMLVSASRAIRTNRVWMFFDVRLVEQTAGTNSVTIKQGPLPAKPFPEFSETPREIRSEISISEGLNSSSRSRTRKADVPLTQILSYLRLHPKPPISVRPWLYTRLHGRFAGPCACLVVVLVAIPLASAPGRRNVFVGVAASIFIFFVYFLLQQVGFALGETNHLPPWLAAWLPNLFFGVGGAWMIARAR